MELSTKKEIFYVNDVKFGELPTGNGETIPSQA